MRRSLKYHIFSKGFGIGRSEAGRLQCTGFVNTELLSRAKHDAIKPLPCFRYIYVSSHIDANYITFAREHRFQKKKMGKKKSSIREKNQICFLLPTKSNN